jgi:mono/diheme cytochrome c family protein
MMTTMMTLRHVRMATVHVSLAAIVAVSSAPAAAQNQPGPPAETSAAAPVGNAANGKVLYGKIGCYQCHSEEGQGGTQGPRLGPRPIAFRHS